MTKAKPEITLTPTMPASITKLVKGHQLQSSCSSTPSESVTVTKTNISKTGNYYGGSGTKTGSATGSASATSGSSSYPFYPSLASMTSLSPTLAMNSNYLLQNLLLGKMQQIANSAAAATVSATTSATTASLPTQPLPAQALSLPPTTNK